MSGGQSSGADRYSNQHSGGGYPSTGTGAGYGTMSTGGGYYGGGMTMGSGLTSQTQAMHPASGYGHGAIGQQQREGMGGMGAGADRSGAATGVSRGNMW